MRLALQFQGQTVKGQGYRRAGAYCVGRTWRPHCLLLCRLGEVAYYFRLCLFVCEIDYVRTVTDIFVNSDYIDSGYGITPEHYKFCSTQAIYC